MTSLVDLAFTLLIVFIIVTPVMLTGVDIDLPESAARAIDGPDERVDILINASGEIEIGEEHELDRDTFLTAVFDQTEGGHHQPVFIHADGSVSYEVVAYVLGALQDSGFTHLNLVTTPQSRASSR